MKPDSAVNLAALAALCGTAGVAGFINARHRNERDRARLREALEELQQDTDDEMVKESFDRDAYCQRYFMRKEAGIRTGFMGWGGRQLHRVGTFIDKNFNGTLGTKLKDWGRQAVGWARNTRQQEIKDFAERQNALKKSIATDEAAANASKANTGNQVTENAGGTTQQQVTENAGGTTQQQVTENAGGTTQQQVTENAGTTQPTENASGNTQQPNTGTTQQQPTENAGTQQQPQQPTENAGTGIQQQGTMPQQGTVQPQGPAPQMNPDSLANGARQNYQQQMVPGTIIPANNGLVMS